MGFKNRLKFFFEVGVLIGITTTFFNYLIGILWQNNGFNEIELTFMSILPGCIIFLTSIIFNYFYINPWLLKVYNQNSNYLKRRYIVLIILVISIVIYILTDSLIFLFDDSISVDYIKFINDLSSENKADQIGLYPISIVNVIVTFIMGLAGSLVSVLLIKRDGKKTFTLKNRI